MRREICARCGKGFSTKRSDRRYCSDRCRYLDWRDRDKAPRACRYCGLAADGVDHIPPQSARERIKELGMSDRFPDVEVPCCGECNSLLGARALWTVGRRKRFIKTALSRRYRRFLRLPAWSNAELSRLGPSLQSSTIAALIIKDLVLERIAY